MSVLLAIFSYPGANETVKRHWPFFLGQEADWIYGIGTTDGKCEWPQGITGSLDIGSDLYIEGPHLPNRMLDTIETMLLMPWSVLMLAEYDLVIFKSIPVEQIETSAAYFAGGPTWGSKAQWYAHSPWCFSRESAIKFLKAGREAIAEDICPDRGRGQPSTPECSPDVFYGFVMDKAGIPFQRDLWREYSKNSFDHPEHLDEARQAYRNGVHCIHGLKTNEQLQYVLS